MASGMTIKDAVNEMVETIGEYPLGASAATPDGTGTSIYDRARQFLDREDKRMQSMGWPENTVMSKEFTASGGDIGIPNTILRVRAAGSSAHRNMIIRDDSGTQKLYDGNADTFAFGSTEKVYLDVVSKLDFIDLPPLMQDVVVAKSKMEFQRRIQGSPQVDAALMQDYAVSQAALDRHPMVAEQPFNTQPLMAGGGGGNREQGQK